MLTLARDNEKWKNIRNSKEYEPIRELIFSEYEAYCKNKDIPLIKFSDEMRFEKDGNRSGFEEKFFTRRRQLSIYCILSLLYPEKEEYILNLEDIICEILNEYSWELSAHRPYENRNKRDGIDLTSAETALYLAEIKYILKERLHPFVVERITNEISWRITEAFKREKQWWEDLKSNWAAVCGGCVGGALLYEDVESYNTVKPRIDKCIENYLDGLGDDGSCSEGAGYWNYGFSFFLLYADLLRSHTKGECDYFKDEKVKKIAKFFDTVYLDEKNRANFSDDAQTNAYMALHYMLNKEYGIDVPPIKQTDFAAIRTSFAIRACLYYNFGVDKRKITPQETYYNLLGWYIKREEHFGFAIKGGHNDEEHNHNDIGSFILTNKGNVIFAELGSGEYTKTYFSSERYTVLNASSLGHSVPILDGEAQKAGREFYSTMTVDENGVTVDMTRAYPTKDKKIIRNCKITHNKFILTDEFNKGTSITERFILLSEPDIKKDGKVIICGVPVSYSDGFNVSIDIVDNMAYNKKRKVYLLDFTPISEVDRFELSADLEG